jgi:U4/U6.U5 tri-snRNP-associated protein 1
LNIAEATALDSQKKKAKRSARKAGGEEDEADGMEVDAVPTFARRIAGDGPENLVDDDDLQAALSRARRAAAKTNPKKRPEDWAEQSEPFSPYSSWSQADGSSVAQSRQEEDAPREDGDEDGRITFDDTSEFVRNVTLESRAAPVKRERVASPVPQEQPVVVKIERTEEGELDEDEDMDSIDEDEALAEMAAREGMSLEEYRLKIDSQMQEMAAAKAEADEVCSTFLSSDHADAFRRRPTSPSQSWDLAWRAYFRSCGTKEH